MIKQVFKVPNNKEGNDFIRLVKKNLQKDMYMRIRGRKPDHEKADKDERYMFSKKQNRFRDSVPLEFALELGVYLFYREEKC